MTIPVVPSNIAATGVVPSQVERLLARVLEGTQIGQRQQELDTQKAQLKLEQDKYKSTLSQHEAEKLQLAQLGEVARALLLGAGPPLPAGSLPWGAGSQTPIPFGLPSASPIIQSAPAEMIPKVLDLLQHVATLQGTGANTQGQVLANRSAEQKAADDASIRAILARVPSMDITPRSIARVVTQVAAIDPARAGQVGETLGHLLPGYTMVQNPSGSVSYIPSRPGLGVRGAPLEAKTTPDQEKVGGFARRVIEAGTTMTQLERRYPGMAQRVDEVLRTVQGVGQLPTIGRAFETQWSPDAWKVAQAMHAPKPAVMDYLFARLDLTNAVLRRASGAQINSEELARESAPYVPMAKMAEAAVPGIQDRRLRLGVAFADEAGPAFRIDRLSPLARRYYVQGLTGIPDDALFAIPGGVTPGVTITPYQPYIPRH